MTQEEETGIALLPMDLQHLSKGALRMLAQDASVDPSILEQILHQEKNDGETVRSLIRNPALPDEAFNKVFKELDEELQKEVGMRQKALTSIDDQGIVEARKKQPGTPRKMGSVDEGNIMKRVQQMSPVEKISMALKGPKEARGLLIRDSNKEIALTVLKNPKMTDSEVEFFAASTNVADDIHRHIGRNREWCKSYNVVRALVFNPKTPVGVSVEKLPYIKDKDLQFLCKSKNVPSVLRAGAKRLIAKKQKKKG
jgi:hypothetical protein